MTPEALWLQGDNGTAKSGSEAARFPITLPSGRVVTPCWKFLALFTRNICEKRFKKGAHILGQRVIACLFD